MNHVLTMMIEFQSTPSLRKATEQFYHGLVYHTFQSTPSLRKATFGMKRYFDDDTFQSTPSLRKATVVVVISQLFGYISIHTFLAEGDIVD